MAGPRIPRLLAQLLLPRRDREVILGDLEELHARRSKKRGGASASLHYLREALASVVARRTGRSPRPRRGRRPTAVQGSILSALLVDLRHAVRTFRREPGFVIIVALTLGVGVGAAGTVFSMANQLLLRPPPGVADPAGNAVLEFYTAERGNTGLSGPDVEELRRSATLFEGFATYDNVGVLAAVDGSRPIDTRASTVYGDYFELLGVRPTVGRLLRAEETGPDADPLVAVISERLWEVLFNRSPEVAVPGQRSDTQRPRCCGRRLPGPGPVFGSRHLATEIGLCARGRLSKRPPLVARQQAPPRLRCSARARDQPSGGSGSDKRDPAEPDPRRLGSRFVLE